MDSFYERLENAFDQLTTYHMKTMLQDLSAKERGYVQTDKWK